MNDQEELKKIFDDWSGANRRIIEKKVAKGFAKIVLRAGPATSRYSTWLLAGSAATTALMIANVAAITEQLSLESYRWCLVLMCFSIASGVVARYLGSLIEISSDVGEFGERLGDELRAEHEEQAAQIEKAAEGTGLSVDTELSEEGVVETMASLFPAILQKRIQKELAKHLEDRLKSARRDVHNFIYQQFAVFMQTSLALGFILVVAFGVAA